MTEPVTPRWEKRTALDGWALVEGDTQRGWVAESWVAESMAQGGREAVERRVRLAHPGAPPLPEEAFAPYTKADSERKADEA